MIAVGDIRNGVLAGRDGYLFLVGGAHDVLACATGKRPLDGHSVATFASNLRHRAASCAAQGAGFLHVLFPDKHSVLPHLFPFAVNPIGKRLIAALEASVLEHLLHPLHILTELADSAFPRLDTHVTDAATARIAIAIVKRLTGSVPIKAQDCVLSSIRREVPSAGDLGIKLDPNKTEVLQLFSPDWRVQSLSNNLQGGNNGIVDLHYHTEAPIAARLLIFGDSFSRRTAYALSAFFTDVLFCRTAFFHDEIFKQMRPDYVITSNVERYLTRVESDDEAPNFLLYPMLATKTCNPDPGFITALSAMLRHGHFPAHALSYAECTRDTNSLVTV